MKRKSFHKSFSTYEDVLIFTVFESTQLLNCISRKSKALDVLDFIYFVFQHLKPRRNPLSTWAFFPWKNHISQFCLTFWAVELYLIFHFISVQPAWLHNKNWSALFAWVQNLWKKDVSTFFASVLAFWFVLSDWGIWLMVTFWFLVWVLFIVLLIY